MKSHRHLFLLLLALLPSVSHAQQGLPPGAEGELSGPTTLLEVLESTGLMLYPLGALSVATVFLVIFYLLTIRQGAVVSDKFMHSAEVLIRKQDYLGLLAVCNRHHQAIARLMEKTLDFATKNPTATFEEVREVTEAEGTRQASLLNQRITYLADIGSIAPMVGLLGTVIGMIKSFRDIGNIALMGDKQNVLATGVSEALLTTAGGLVIGIPALIFYALFRGRVQRLVAEMEAAATHLSALLAAQYKRNPLPHQATGLVQPQPHQAPIPNQQVQPPYQTNEPDYFSEYSVRDRTIDPHGL